MNPPGQRLLFLFLDGVGIGRADQGNPFFARATRFLPCWQGGGTLPDGTPLRHIRSDVGLEGIPQSATGQTALFTGARGPELGPAPVSGYPGKGLRRLLRQRGLLVLAKQRGCQARFFNAYPLHEELFRGHHVRLDEDGTLHFSDEFPVAFRRRLSATSVMMIAIGQQPAGLPALEAGEALYQDYTNRSLGERGATVVEFTPERAGEILAAARGQVVLYEYFQSDVCGHRGDPAAAGQLVGELDRLLGTLIACLDPGRDTLVVTSDHGNLEDLSSRGHSRNPVPFLAWGRLGDELRARVSAIEEVTPALLELGLLG